MRSVAFLAVLCAATVAHAGGSNPAFLGIQMGGSQAGPCIIESVTRGSAAKAAGLARNDEIRVTDLHARPVTLSSVRLSWKAPFFDGGTPITQYRIDVPVYASPDDTLTRTGGRIATQTFTLPAAGDTLSVALAVSP